MTALLFRDGAPLFLEHYLADCAKPGGVDRVLGDLAASSRAAWDRHVTADRYLETIQDADCRYLPALEHECSTLRAMVERLAEEAGARAHADAIAAGQSGAVHVAPRDLWIDEHGCGRLWIGKAWERGTDRAREADARARESAR